MSREVFMMPLPRRAYSCCLADAACLEPPVGALDAARPRGRSDCAEAASGRDAREPEFDGRVVAELARLPDRETLRAECGEPLLIRPFEKRGRPRECAFAESGQRRAVMHDAQIVAFIGQFD